MHTLGEDKIDLFYNKTNIVKEVITPTIRLRLLTDSIIHYTFFKDVEIDVEQHKINHNALVSIATLKQHPLLIDATEFVTITPEARKFIRSLEPVTPILARAMVTNSLANKLLITFYNKVNKPMYPLKVFNNYNDAQKWLLTL